MSDTDSDCDIPERNPGLPTGSKPVMTGRKPFGRLLPIILLLIIIGLTVLLLK